MTKANSFQKGNSSNPRGAGRKSGSTKDRVKLGISISRKNADWLRDQKGHGKSISRIIDDALERARSEG